jgi:hypothetical protein
MMIHSHEVSRCRDPTPGSRPSLPHQPIWEGNAWRSAPPPIRADRRSVPTGARERPFTPKMTTTMVTSPGPAVQRGTHPNPSGLTANRTNPARGRHSSLRRHRSALGRHSTLCPASLPWWPPPPGPTTFGGRLLQRPLSGASHHEALPDQLTFTPT